MTKASFTVTPLDLKTHDRKAFASENEALNHYFHTQVGQDIKRRVTTCFVAVTPLNEIAGYYTLAPHSVSLADLPEDQRKNLPRYPTVPAYLLGRLAVSAKFKGQGLGGALLADALQTAKNLQVMGHALVVDAIDDNAVQFYLHHGFIPFQSQPMALFFPLAPIP